METHTHTHTHICIHTHTHTHLHTYRAFACATTMTATEHHCYVMLQEFVFLSQLFLSNNLFSHGSGLFFQEFIKSLGLEKMMMHPREDQEISQILELVSHFEGKNWISKTRRGWTTFFFNYRSIILFLAFLAVPKTQKSISA